ncbi:MAG: NAD-binding protein [Chloroflexi bacterium]|nr:NAD-binding protein [Chloroflexota bacterium]MCL5074528.1 NAD-binding protein [Chloroflexota bacterium]
MFVVIIGGGLVGRHLAAMLLGDKQKVVIIEKNPAVAATVAKEVGVKVVEGDGDDPKVLAEAGTRGADVFIAVTGEDEDNLVAATLAKFEFLVPRVMARVNNPKNEWMFGKDMGVDIAINQVTLIAHLLEEEMTLGDLVTLLKLREGDVALVEKPITEGSKAIKRQVSQLGLPEDIVCVAVLRAGRVLFPKADLTLERDDRLLLLTTVEREQQVAEILA